VKVTAPPLGMAGIATPVADCSAASSAGPVASGHTAPFCGLPQVAVVQASPLVGVSRTTAPSAAAGPALLATTTYVTVEPDTTDVWLLVLVIDKSALSVTGTGSTAQPRCGAPLATHCAAVVASMPVDGGSCGSPPPATCVLLSSVPVADAATTASKPMVAVAPAARLLLRLQVIVPLAWLQEKPPDVKLAAPL